MRSRILISVVQRDFLAWLAHRSWSGTFIVIIAAWMGSFLRGYAKWQKKWAASELTNDRTQKQWNEKAKIQVFPTATPPPAPSSTDDFINRAHFDHSVEFDPEKDYAQVLAEARRHLKSSGAASDVQAASNVVSSKPISWLQNSPQLAAYRELESACAAQTTKASRASRLPGTKLWRSVFFWQRFKKKKQQQQQQHEGDDDQEAAERIESIFATPQHPSFKPPRSKSSSGRANSGPILYTDGLPSGRSPSNRGRKPWSGTIMLFSGGVSPYEELKKVEQKLAKPCSTSLPLYSV